jgi:hypothetical protein
MVHSIKIIIGIVLIGLLGPFVLAQENGEKTFASPTDASNALYDAVKAGDKPATEAILGASSAPILASGDEVQDKHNAEVWLQRYEQMHRWGKATNGDQTLYIGADNWPFSIPLKKNASGQWYFDTKAGLQEILFRRIGANEFAAIRVCKALADAQYQYFDGLHDGSTVHQYAQKIISEPGKQNGLYWKTAEGDPESPIGPIIAYATRQGYEKKSEPFHGYFYHILTAQGAAAPGGAKSYIVNGAMTQGFAFIAWPAEYRNSGVMTFVVNLNGVIFEKDMGPNTADLVNAMTGINPDKTWRPITPETDAEAESQ